MNSIALVSILSILFFVFCIVWMVQVLKQIRSTRIMTSMMLQIEKKKAEKEGIKINLEELHDEAAKHA